jgi:hypothetical protein
MNDDGTQRTGSYSRIQGADALHRVNKPWDIS